MGKMIVAGVASIPNRAKNLEATLKSILPQVDLVHVYLNNYIHLPECLQNDKILVYRSEAYGDKGDAGKFFKVPENCYYISIDDDIIYPKDYVKTLVNKLDEYSGQIIVSHHGRVLHPYKIKSYYHNKLFVHHCLHREEKDRPVHLGGTGVMAFDTNYFRPEWDWFERPNMADIWIAKYAQSQKMPILALQHPANYLKYQADVVDTIHSKSVNNDKIQTNICNSIAWTIYEAELE